MPSSTPTPAAPEFYTVVTGFSVDVAGVPAAFCPPVGSTWPAQYEPIAQLVASGAVGRLILPADASEVEIRFAQARSWDLPSPPEEPAPPAPVEPPKVRALRTLQVAAAVPFQGPGYMGYGGVGVAMRIIEAGAEIPADDPAARANPGDFEPVE